MGTLVAFRKASAGLVYIVGNKKTLSQGCTEKCFEHSHFYKTEFPLIVQNGKQKNLRIKALEGNCDRILVALKEVDTEVNPRACAENTRSKHFGVIYKRHEFDGVV